MALKLADRVHETTSTTGTGNVALLGAVARRRTFTAAIGVGNSTYYVIEQIDFSGTITDWEIGIGTVTAGPALTRDTVIASSNSNLLVNWGAGTKDIYGTVSAGAILLVAGLLAEIAALGSSAQDTALGNLGATSLGRSIVKAPTAAAVRTLLALGTSATIDVGTTALKILQLDAAGKLPAIDISQALNTPRFLNNLAPAWTGGSNSTIVRYNGSGTVTAADKSDLVDLLEGKLFCRGSDGALYSRGQVPFAGAVDGTRYFLGAAGALRTSAGTAGDAFNSIAEVGFGLPAISGVAQLWFDPKIVIGAVITSGVPVKIESGLWKS